MVSLSKRQEGGERTGIGGRMGMAANFRFTAKPFST
jgi:hypothetical protein